MLNRFKSIKTKLIFLYILLLIAILISTGYYLHNSLRSYFLNFMEDRIYKELRLIEAEITPLLLADKQEELVNKINRMGDNLETRITLINLAGEPLADSKEDYQAMENHLDRPEVQTALAEGYGENKRFSSTLGIKMRYIAYPIKVDNEEIAIIRAATDLDNLEQLYQDIWSVLFRAGLIAILVTILISYRSINKITAPIIKITNLAEEIAAGNLGKKINLKAKDEVGRLARMFNHMATKIEAKITELSNEKNKIEAIISSINDGIIAVDKEGKIILFNLGAEEMFKSSSQQVIGKNLIETTKNYKLVEFVNKALKNSETITEEINILLPEERIFRIQVSPIKNDENLLGAVLVLRDVTEIRQLENMRRDFVSNVSHELKTPLTSIKGYIETLLASEIKQEQAESFMKVINEEANRLERLISDLLDLSKIESDSEFFDMQQVDLREVIKDAIAVLENKADKKNINLQFSYEQEPLFLTGDRDQLVRLVINLVDNAIKYTPNRGKVLLKAQEKNRKIELVVKDNGIGIPESDLSRIFERFYRVDKARSRKAGGTGLGLSIVKHILKQHDGEIDVESEQEQGTKFIISLRKNNS